MRLVALIAAKRFGQRRLLTKTRERRTPWFALTLGWRRGVKRAPLNVACATLPALSHSWFSQFHLHFGAAAKPNERQTHVLTRATQRTPIVWRQMPDATHLARPNRPRSSSGPEREAPLRRPRQELTLRHRMIRELHTMISSKAPQIRSRLKDQAVFGPVDLPPRRLVMHALVHRRQAAGSIASNLPRRAPMKPAPLVLTGTRRYLPNERSSEPLEMAKRRAPVMPSRAPDLVWRATAKAASNESAQAAVDAVTPLSPPTARASAPAAATQAPWQAQANGAARPLTLDNAMVDRLAEDVIRRVERRIRIERERRGV